MSTRMYFGQTDLPNITPAIHSSWDQTLATIPRGTLKPAPEMEGVPGAYVNLRTGIKSSSTTPWDMFAGQFISRPLPIGGTLDGTATVVVTAYEDAIANDMMLQCVIRIVSNDGLTVRGVAYAGQTNTTVVTTQNALNQELTLGIPEARVMSALALSPVAYQAGDRIVVELGVRSVRASASGRATLFAADSEDMPPTYDLVAWAGVGVGAAYEAAHSNRIRPWIEFSDDLYPTVGTEEFRFQEDGVLLNSSPSLPFVDITNVEGLDSAGVRLVTHDREGIHGGYASSTFETLRTITLEGNIYANPSQLETYLDLLKKNFAPTRRDRKFFFGTDAGARFCWGKSQGLRYNKDAYRRLGVVPFQVQIVCQDPRQYAVTEQTVTIASTASDSLAPLAGTFGNRESPAIVRFFGPTSGGNAQFLMHNRFGRFRLLLGASLSLAATEVVTVDLDKRTVTKNYMTNVRDSVLVEGFWAPLSEVGNTVNFSHILGTTFNGTISWRAAWR